MMRLAAACVAATVGLAAVARADVTVRLEAGTEIDSNVHRVTTERGAEEAAAGARGGVRMAGNFELPRSLLRFSALAAGKLYPAPDASSENVAVLAADARWDLAVDRLSPGVRISYYDASVAALSEGVSFDHAFRTGQAAAALTMVSDDHHRIEAWAGARFFDYKPSREFDFTGGILGLTVGKRLRNHDATAELAYAASYYVSQRAYQGRAVANHCGETIQPTCLELTEIPRADLFQALAVEATYTREFILAARYELQINASNSYGQSLLRHRLELTGTSELLWDIFGSAKLVLVVNQFLDALLLGGDVGTFVTIEDEARNGIILHLTRDVSRSLGLEARYAFYTNPFAQQALEYRRHTFYLGVVYSFGR